MTPKIPSSEVPQANSLGRVISFVRECAAPVGGGVSGAFSHPRDRQYYSHAARILGLIDEACRPTLLGRRLATAGGDNQTGVLGEAFAQSRVGRCWLEWAGASGVASLPAATAAAFLAAKTSMSAATVARRASTLRRWVRELQDGGSSEKSPAGCQKQMGSASPMHDEEPRHG